MTRTEVENIVYNFINSNKDFNSDIEFLKSFGITLLIKEEKLFDPSIEKARRRKLLQYYSFFLYGKIMLDNKIKVSLFRASTKNECINEAREYYVDAILLAIKYDKMKKSLNE